ncbi:transcription factor MafB-like [Pyrus x bretschneideri]|uniref:transcription factor MafB-like n=1 Tax=Pyrus x bretschneideri TaxID=225117 RepID=UPI002030A33A|nr:transcription factor MafB-like [Pyrus x bretschneideri]
MIELDQIGRTQPIWPPHCFNPYLVRILKLEFTPSSCPSLISLPTKPMDPPHGGRPCLLHHPHHHLHHHHHRHPLFLSPLHHRRHHHHHFHHLRLNFASFPQNREPPAAAPIPFPTHMNSEPSELKEAHYDDPTFLTLPEQTYGEIGEGVVEEEEDDEPIFVLTDEWKEFLAKCEAKRKLEKQQAKKKGKYKQSQE